MLIEDYLELKRKTKEEHSKSLDIFKSVSFLEHLKILSHFVFIIVTMFFSFNYLIFNKYSSVSPLYGFSETFSFYELNKLFEFMINNGAIFNNYLDSIGILFLGSLFLISVYNIYFLKKVLTKADMYILTTGFTASLCFFIIISFSILVISIVFFINLLLGDYGRRILEFFIQEPSFFIFFVIFCYSIISIIVNVVLYSINKKHSFRELELFYSKINQLRKQTESCKNKIIKNKQEVKYLAQILRNYQEFDIGETKTLIFDCNYNQILDLESLFKDYESFILDIKNKEKELKKYDSILEKEDSVVYAEIKNI